MTNKSMRDYINLIEDAQKEDQLNEFAPDGFNGGDDPFDPEMAKFFYEQGRIKANSVTDGVKVANWLENSHIEDQYKQYWLKGWREGREQKKAFYDKDAKQRGYKYDYRPDDYSGLAEEQLEETTPDAVAKVEQLFRHK